MTSTRLDPGDVFEVQLGALRQRPRQGRRPATDRTSEKSSTFPMAGFQTGRSTPYPTASSQSTEARQTHPRDLQTFLDAGDTRGGCSTTSGSTRATRSSATGSGPSTSRTLLGPVHALEASPTVLEVATTYDPATPFRGAKRLATQLGNVRFLTMVGDGHTAFTGGSPLHRRRPSSRTSRRSRSRTRARSASRTSRSCSRRRSRPRRSVRCRAHALELRRDSRVHPLAHLP